jgi:hypothetical protein
MAEDAMAVVVQDRSCLTTKRVDRGAADEIDPREIDREPAGSEAMRDGVAAEARLDQLVSMDEASLASG